MRKKIMGKLLFTSGSVLLLLVSLLVTASAMPPEWLTYIADKIYTLFAGEPRHVYVKVVPSTGNESTGYFVLAGLSLLAITLIYYGKKLNRGQTQ